MEDESGHVTLDGSNADGGGEEVKSAEGSEGSC